MTIADLPAVPPVEGNVNTYSVEDMHPPLMATPLVSWSCSALLVVVLRRFAARAVSAH